MSITKNKKGVTLKLKKYVYIFKPSLLALFIVMLGSSVLSLLYLFSNFVFYNSLQTFIDRILNNILVSYLSTMIVWGLIGFILYFIIFESFQIGEELEFDVKEIFEVKWPKGKNPVGPLENTMIRIFFRSIIFILILILSMKGILIISRDFSHKDNIMNFFSIFITSILFAYLELVLFRMLLLKNRLFNNIVK